MAMSLWVAGRVWMNRSFHISVRRHEATALRQTGNLSFMPLDRAALQLLFKFIVSAAGDIFQPQTCIVITGLVANKTAISVVFPRYSYG